MSYRILSFFLSAVLFSAQIGRAQDKTDTESPAQTESALQLSLKLAVDIALSPGGNTRVRIAQELVRQAQARSLQSCAALLPNIDASFGQQNVTRNLAAFGIQVQLPFPDYNFPTFVGPYNVFDARATASLNVLNLSSIRRYQSSRKGVRLAEDEREDARDQVRAVVAHTACKHTSILAQTLYTEGRPAGQHGRGHLRPTLLSHMPCYAFHLGSQDQS